MSSEAHKVHATAHRVSCILVEAGSRREWGSPEKRFPQAWLRKELFVLKRRYHTSLPRLNSVRHKKCSNKRQFPTFCASVRRKQRTMSPLVLILVILLVVALFGGGYGFRRGNNVLAGGAALSD
jgi:hypothetical protein